MTFASFLKSTMYNDKDERSLINCDGLTTDSCFRPTQVPTFEPTQVPTFGPTQVPTFGPTQVPTFEPSTSPSTSQSPSSQPTTTSPLPRPSSSPSYPPSQFKSQNYIASAESQQVGQNGGPKLIAMTASGTAGFVLICISFFVYRVKKRRKLIKTRTSKGDDEETQADEDSKDNPHVGTTLEINSQNNFDRDLPNNGSMGDQTDASSLWDTTSQKWDNSYFLELERMKGKPGTGIIRSSSGNNHETFLTNSNKPVYDFGSVHDDIEHNQQCQKPVRVQEHSSSILDHLPSPPPPPPRPPIHPNSNFNNRLSNAEV